MNEGVYAIIPARGGSKGVPDKNIKLLGGFPLIAYSIAAAKLSNRIHKVIVSTDNEHYLQIAKQFGADILILRPQDLATDGSPDKDFMVHAIAWLQSNNISLPKYWVHLRPTTPLRTVSIVDQAVDLFIQTPSASSLRSAHECSESPYKWFVREHEFFVPLAKSISTELVNLPRQQLPKVYIPNGYVDVLLTDFFARQNSLHGSNILAYETPVCSEIDTQEDFKYLEYELTQTENFNDIFLYLNKNYKAAAK